MRLTLSRGSVLSEIKESFITFHYAEKIKSDLIITASLLEALTDMTDEEIVGAEKLLVAYFNALIKEVNIATNASKVQGFQEVSTKLEEAIQQTRQHNYTNAERLVSEAVSITTTNGSRAIQVLKEKSLI